MMYPDPRGRQIADFGVDREFPVMASIVSARGSTLGFPHRRPIGRQSSPSPDSPRSINQLTVQALIYGVVHGLDSIDTKTVDATITEHPLYQAGHAGAE